LKASVLVSSNNDAQVEEGVQEAVALTQQKTPVTDYETLQLIHETLNIINRHEEQKLREEGRLKKSVIQYLLDMWVRAAEKSSGDKRVHEQCFHVALEAQDLERAQKVGRDSFN
jgi:hypothetical protein